MNENANERRNMSVRSIDRAYISESDASTIEGYINFIATMDRRSVPRSCSLSVNVQTYRTGMSHVCM